MTIEAKDLYTIFHLNLAFSSIEISEQKTIIDRCYWPLLHLIEEEHFPVGIELSGYTLERIADLDSCFIDNLKHLLNLKRCEILASGDSQIIGPLVPAEVNFENLRLGQELYQSYLGVQPEIAFVNEQSISTGLIDVYLENRFSALVAEWDNLFAHNDNWPEEALNAPASLRSINGHSIKVIWNYAIAFQKFQRYAHGELFIEDYIDWIKSKLNAKCKAFCLYGSDAEVFNFRPGRYKTEARNSLDEWCAIKLLIQRLKTESEINFTLPSECLRHHNSEHSLNLASALHPISVKKQAKYNITRWGLSGRDDLNLNTYCHKKLKEISSSDSNDTQWRSLCRLWASDYRTHIKEKRFSKIAPLSPKKIVEDLASKTIHLPANIKTLIDRDRNQVLIENENIKLKLNLKRGLSIDSLAFSQHDFIPVCGTLGHGYFNHISYGVDFFSNHLVVERFRERDRITDLYPVEFSFSEFEGQASIIGKVNTPMGILSKVYCLGEDSIECIFQFENNSRPEASLRLGFISLLNCQKRLWFSCKNGGYQDEFYQATKDFDHGKPVSSIVSATSSLGATDGQVLLGCDTNALKISWQPDQCAALPMLSSTQVNDGYLNRFWFSLVESDETLKPGGYLPPFRFRIGPSLKPPL